MEQLAGALAVISAGFIVPFVQWLKTKMPDLPFASFAMVYGLNVAVVFGLNAILKTGLDPGALVMIGLGVGGTIAAGVHSLVKTKKKVKEAKK